MSEIKVDVVYALPEKQYFLRVFLEEGTTVEKAIQISKLLEYRQDIDLKKNKVGIYNRLVKLSDVVRDNDRIEIYRPLVSNPKELRRQQVKKSGK